MLAVTAAGFALALLGGLLWGVACRQGMDEGRILYWISNLASPWLVVGFAAGSLTRFPVAGAVFGAAALVAGMIAYYDPAQALGGDLIYARATAETWTTIAFGAGLAFGWAGATWRAGHPLGPFAVGLLASTIAVESIAALAGHFYLEDGGDRAFFTVALLVAGAIPLLLFRSPAAIRNAYLAGLPITAVGYAVASYALDHALI